MNSSKTTLVIGASEKAERYSNKAIKLLLQYDYKVLALGLRKGKVMTVDIETDISRFRETDIDTITLYINPLLQIAYYEEIVGLKPKRVIFNPGTENPEFENILAGHHIETEEACTLVLLNTHQY